MAELPHQHDLLSQRLMQQLPQAEDFSAPAALFRLLGDGNRLRLFWLLCHCEECVIDLSAMMGMSSPALSHHLRSLKAANLIVSRRSGKEVYYRAADTEAAQALHHMMEELLAIACPTGGDRA